MFKKAGLAGLAAGFAIIGLVTPVGATEPATGTGAFTLASAVTTGGRIADGNLFITQIQTYNDTGVLAGVETDLVNIVFHPDGTFNATADVIFVGTVAGHKGTLEQQFETTGNAVTFQGQLQTLSGTGGLANLHGVGSFVGSSSTFAGTYTFQYHFDP
jgi:hypothetical protein